MTAAAIWPWKCKTALFQYNEVYNTVYNQDGQAWDADSGDGTIYQYNYSCNNGGGCVMFCEGESVNNIFRYNIKNKTELGVEALKYIDKGELVPDELTNKIVKDRLAMDDAKNGWILDGYPRNASQVEALDAILGELDTPLDAVVALDADHDVLMERMKKRAEIEGRSDDTPEAIAKRLDVYAKETAPLLDIYQKRGLLKTFNGVGAVDEIQATIVAELG